MMMQMCTAFIKLAASDSISKKSVDIFVVTQTQHYSFMNWNLPPDYNNLSHDATAGRHVMTSWHNCSWHFCQMPDFLK